MTKPRLFTAALFIAVSISMSTPLAPAVAVAVAQTETATTTTTTTEAPAVGAPAITASLTPSLSVIGNSEQRARVDEVKSSFASLGLELPDLVIRFWNENEPCDGHMGIFRPRAESSSVDICSDLAFVLPHELAHAWERGALSDSDRQAYMADRGFETWQNVERNESAIEDVAHVTQLVVMGGGESGRANVDDAFRLLMGLSAK